MGLSRILPRSSPRPEPAAGEPASEPATGLHATPIVTANGAGLILGGRF